mmetsp:Transcript_31251/g.105132  ORF Transcript_31251/g.105132 Transcript_31251/m.105132 type:complete len:236 (-) Transcript_31251:6605-7312(-)
MGFQRRWRSLRRPRRRAVVPGHVRGRRVLRTERNRRGGVVRGGLCLRGDIQLFRRLVLSLPRRIHLRLWHDAGPVALRAVGPVPAFVPRGVLLRRRDRARAGGADKLCRGLFLPDGDGAPRPRRAGERRRAARLDAGDDRHEAQAEERALPVERRRAPRLGPRKRLLLRRQRRARRALRHGHGPLHSGGSPVRGPAAARGRRGRGGERRRLDQAHAPEPGAAAQRALRARQQMGP